MALSLTAKKSYAMSSNQTTRLSLEYADSYRVIYVGDGATIEELVGRVDAPAPPQAGARELHHLGVLLDVARALGTGLSLEDILTVVLDAAIQLTSTERGVLLLLTGPSSKLQTAVARNAKRETLRPEELQVSESIVRTRGQYATGTDRRAIRGRRGRRKSAKRDGAPGAADCRSDPH